MCEKQSSAIRMGSAVLGALVAVSLIACENDTQSGAEPVSTAMRADQPANSAACDAIVGRWRWFTGGSVAISPDGTMVHDPGNDGTWACTNAAGAEFTLTWRLGGYVNTVALSADGNDLSSTDPSQAFVTASRIGAGAVVNAEAEAHFDEGLAYYEIGGVEEAGEEFSKAIEIDPAYVWAHYNLGVVHHDLEEYGRALAELSTAIELDPAYAKAYSMRADVHDHLGDVGSALHDLEMAQQLGHEVDADFLEELREANR
jgi:tetratricopeptide (TPR) repeat protein